MALLEVREVSKRFGGLVACDRISLRLDQGESVGLIGPNGAGKTTLFNCIAGYYSPTHGHVVFKNTDITGWRPSAICRLGIGRTFQVVKPVRQMTVLENVMVGSFCRTSSAPKAREAAEKILCHCGLESKRHQLAGSLTLADRKRLEIARAWATQPDLLLLDEVMAGLTASETQIAVDLIKKIHSSGVTLLVVEHVMEALIPLVDRIIVLDRGKKIAEGSPETVLKDERVVSAYLGGETDVAG